VLRAPADTIAAIPLPASPEARAQAVVELAQRLDSLIGREHEALEAGRLSELAGLADQRLDLLQRFEALVRVVRLDREGLAALPPELAQDLRRAVAALAQQAAEHAERMTVATEAQRRVIDGLVQMVNRERRMSAGYSWVRRPTQTAAPIRHPAALSIDTRL